MGSQRSVPIFAVVGATASGKSDLALDIAERVGGEIVNTDSMQIYRGMDIGTAKLPVADRRGITHHLLDRLDPSEPATVAQFQTWARVEIEDCLVRGVSPVLVGGSALYTRAILDRFEFPGTDVEIRARLEAELEELGSAALHARLMAIDPRAGGGIEIANGRRVVRALEVIEITGSPYGAGLPELTYHYPDTGQIGVDIDRPTLDQRIAQRVERMWESGLVDEVRRLEAPIRAGRTASKALGYAQVLAFLAGDLTEAEAREKTITGTRRFARRQDGWFRKDPRVRWVDHDDPERLDKSLA